MQLRWSPDAAADFEAIVQYIRRDNLPAARRTAGTIYARVGALAKSPLVGRYGRVEGTRELPLPPLPYIVVYRVLEQAATVEIVNILHGAQQWPPLR